MKKSLFLLAILACTFESFAQWTNHYPKVDGFGHHVYLEGFELPVLNSGPNYPAISPDGSTIAFSAKGWLWLMDTKSKIAKRITSSGGMDSRPQWSADGKFIVFIRDSGDDTGIYKINSETLSETMVIDEAVLELDPSFSVSGDILFTSAKNGPLNIWKHSETGGTQPITRDRGVQRKAYALSDGSVVYLAKGGSNRIVRQMNNGEISILAEDWITSQTDLAVSPDERYIAYTWPQDDDYELRLMDINIPSSNILLTKSDGLPMAPAFSPDGQWIYYSETNSQERTELKRISLNGGKPELYMPSKWDWNTPTGKITLKTSVDGNPAPVRMSVTDSNGHPIIPEEGAVRFDGQNGMVFFYADKEITLEMPAGDGSVTIVQGFETTAKTESFTTKAGENSTVAMDLNRIWSAVANGWYSGDNHFHLNYGGTYQLDTEDLVLPMKGEQLDVGFPLLANLHNRFLEQDLWGQEYTKGPMIFYGQEVRSHFLGHLGLIGTSELFWPWIWGPGYQVYGTDDRLNSEVLHFAQDKGGLAGYVHPVADKDPFTEEGMTGIPVSLVADGVLGEADWLEVACLWTDEIGTGTLWHQFLNLGIPMAASAGSDVMTDYYHTMAVGATRVYVRPDGILSKEYYLKALKEGRSFVSNGPMIEFEVNGMRPGDVLGSGGNKVSWTLDIHSPVPCEKVEILVNGEVVVSKKGFVEAGSHSYKGKISVPENGWISARVYGGTTVWPVMDSYPFAESSPVWISSPGTADPEAARAAAVKLLDALNAAEVMLKNRYGDNPVENNLKQFGKAREKLNTLIEAK
ncbi:CehA/McbA family metallohydrolase [Fulvivirga sedimenti]|uniref:CehA/McbA family metallohydrolase n=1 Tax=Fulvivirga sedimenti TaxID=2879465 RepID=A0A9X1HXC3_9BACT|nr:CehA/McbA family metallohydrolase [Fulvivirga sedimenti]MCA6079075.1 CehA/McbA family metallohydrolase [Fulvivirga sedimenti]